jgi:hypothetical protein
LWKEIFSKESGREHSTKKNLLNNLLARFGLSHSQQLNERDFKDKFNQCRHEEIVKEI